MRLNRSWILAAGACSTAMALAACGSSNGTSSDAGPVDDGHPTDGPATDAGSKDAPTADADAGKGDSGGHKDAAPSEGGACTTTINVTVKDPTGQYPIPNVAVYASTGSLPTIKPGAGTCPKVPSSATHTGAKGTTQVTASTEGTINVVAQIGKWRTSTGVTATCGVTATTIELPGSTSSTSNVPAIAVSTGEADTLECTLHRMGIDGAVTVYQGAGGAKGATSTTSSTTLWSTSGQLEAFDAVLLSCEGAETTGAMPDNLSTYAAAGGMVYAEHWQYSWFNAAPFTSDNIATWTTGSNFLTGTTNAVIEANTLGTPLTTWISSLGLLVGGELPMANTEAAHNATLGSASTLVIAADATASAPNAPLLFSWGGTSGGRFVYADFHIGSSTGDYGTVVGATSVPTGASYPTGCATESALKPAEVVFLYTLFEDLSCGL